MISRPIFVVSGGMGASAAQVLDTVLAQFDTQPVEVIKIPLVRSSEQLEDALERAASAGALVIHTLVDAELRQILDDRAEALGVTTVDLFGRLMQCLSSHLGCAPMAHPGRFRELNRSYCERMEAIEFAMQHDDSQSAFSLNRAEIILLGVSRSGKTPLSMYLAMQGWKVANVSYVPGVELPVEFASAPRSRIVGLMLSPAELIAHRQRRQRDFGLEGPTPYVNERGVFEELEALRGYLKQQRILMLDVTNKPIESTAREVVTLILARRPGLPLSL